MKYLDVDLENNQLEDIEAIMKRRHRNDGNGYDGGALPAGSYFSTLTNSGNYVRAKVLKVDRMNRRLRKDGEKSLQNWKTKK